MPNEPVKKPVPQTKKHIARLQRERTQTRIIVYVFFSILAAVIALLIYGWLDLNYLQRERPVAVVGERKILVKDFEARVRLQRQQLLNQYSQYAQYAQFFGLDVSAQMEQIAATLNTPLNIGQSVLDQMINEEIIRQEAAKRGITVSEEELSEAVQGAFGFFPNGTPTPSATPTQVVFPDVPPEAFLLVSATPPPSPTPPFTATPQAGEATPEPSATPTQTLAPSPSPTAGPSATPLPTATPFTYEGYQKLLEQTNEDLVSLGFSPDYYRSFFEVQILERKLREAITTDVPRVELQVWARHILVSDGSLADELVQRLKNGEDFGALAREYSTDTGTAQNGGDLGWFGHGVMVPEFESAAFALEKSGDFTIKPVQSSFGIHIIQLIAKQERPLTPEEYESRKATAFAEWLVSAREEYGVTTHDIWKQRVPTEPNFATAATESANAALTQQAEFLQNFNTTATPTP
jgi:parvulin-like peptidyl-prolyl isomerase